MATTNGGLGSRLRTKAGVALTSFALVGGAMVGTVAMSSPAQAACKSDVHWDDFWSSGAEAHTEDCTWISRSIASHGSRYADSGWYTGWSGAWADSGVSFSHYAYNLYA